MLTPSAALASLELQAEIEHQARTLQFAPSFSLRQREFEGCDALEQRRHDRGIIAWQQLQSTSQAEACD